MSEVTVAWVAVIPDTLLTLAEADEASDDVDWAAISDWNCDPFCSSSTRLEVGVLAEKKASQFALIVAAADPVGFVADDAGDEVAEVPLEPELGFPELPQAVRSRPNPARSTGSARTRRVMGRNRIVSASLLALDPTRVRGATRGRN
jgi:hypothetical protein